MRLPSVLFYVLPILLSCNSSTDSTNAKGKNDSLDNTGNSKVKTNTDKQLNINILWDLSDRIDPSVNPAAPQHYERDIEIIKTFTEAFKKEMEFKGAYKAKGKIKVFFTPPPNDDEINTIARNLSY